MSDRRIIVISNRGVRPSRKGATLFKNKLTKSDHVLRCAEVNPGSHRNKYSLTLQPEGTEQQYINDAVKENQDRPWVFFIHGNNQTLDKNLEKCFKLRELYDVNVLAFSWPSVHHGKLRNIAGYVPVRPGAAGYVKRQVIRKARQYGKAKKNAKLSAPHFAKALDIAKNAFNGSDQKPNFIAHSLGNYVLELSNDLESLSSSMDTFKRVLLHQGDADDNNHMDWVGQILSPEIIITTNRKDKILEASNLFNHKSFDNKRLGNVPKSGSNGSVTYMDFTGADKIGFSGHTMFLIPPSKNPDVAAFFHPLIST